MFDGVKTPPPIIFILGAGTLVPFEDFSLMLNGVKTPALGVDANIFWSRDFSPVKKFFHDVRRG
ncbi:MAG: hypothetical protein B5M52_06935 [Helicobacteraceae bacterium 4484_230]|nr:MAG: hypothetical protein B5M52_06935 [Helicobacteraceae bacterium 4484_230]